MIRRFALAAAAALLASSAQAATVVVNQTLTLDQPNCFCEDFRFDTGTPVDVDIAVGDTLELNYDFLGDQQLRISLVGEIFPFLGTAAGEANVDITVTGVLSFLDLGGNVIFQTTSATQTAGSAYVGQYFVGADFPSGTLPLTFAGFRWVGTIDAYGGGVTTRRYDKAMLGMFGETEKLGVAAIPEPSTWAMMILGFGFAGAGLRARRLQLA